MACFEMKSNIQLGYDMRRMVDIDMAKDYPTLLLFGYIYTISNSYAVQLYTHVVFAFRWSVNTV